nr:isoprenyl transferase [bacterium]
MKGTQAKSQLNIPAELVPRHVGIIMDGNGRWAQKRLMPRTFGHRAGMEAFKEIVRATDDFGIEALTVYALSSENWSRPKEEVSALMGLLQEYFLSQIDELHRQGVRIRVIGDGSRAPLAARQALERAQELTRNNTGLKLTVAFGYGARMEIVGAARELCRRVARGEISPDEVDEQAFEGHLYTHGLPPLDVIIRTGGEMRLSNFLLYQAAYAEFVFVDTLWPDFDRRAYASAIESFAARDRRFGGLMARSKE